MLTFQQFLNESKISAQLDSNGKEVKLDDIKMSSGIKLPEIGSVYKWMSKFYKIIKTINIILFKNVQVLSNV